jgi:esterase/lipase
MAWQWVLTAVVAGLAGLAAYVALVPSGLGRIASHPRPAASYAEAVSRVEALRAREGAELHPKCRVILMSHGQKTARAVVFAHGYTSCPHQFRPLGERLFNMGYNVLIVPLPRHGLTDRMTEAHGRLSAEELAAYTDEVVDIGRGLGEHVTLAGLSCGGVVTAWAAQTRADLDQAVVMSAALGFQGIRRPLTVASMNAALALPDKFVWWDPVEKDKGGVDYTYPRYSRRALGQILRLGYAALGRARKWPPGAKSIVVVTNAHDASVDNWAAARLAEAWRRGGARQLRAYEFPEELKLGHDMIDPEAKEAQPEVVFPKLIELING